MVQDLVLDPFSGLSGDMLLGLLVDLGLDLEALQRELASLALPSFRLEAERVTRSSIAGTLVRVILPKEAQPCRHLAGIKEIIRRSSLSERVQTRAIGVFSELAKAEARVHGVDPEEVHFHEIGALDTIIDICGVVLALEQIRIERVWSLPIALGSGFVNCAHGRLPIPPPAVAELLAGFPQCQGGSKGEMTTPTGAVLAATLAKPLPAEVTYVPERVGYGAGTRDSNEVPNLVRGWLAQVLVPAESELLFEISAQVDDLTGEVASHALGRILQAGAVDAWITQVLMKKGRPGLLLSALARQSTLPTVEKVMLAETTSLGLRRHLVTRTRLPRRVEEYETSLGRVRCKVRTLPVGGEDWSVEYEDAQRLAAEKGMPLTAVLALMGRELP